jgi:hypothetical protein
MGVILLSFVNMQGFAPKLTRIYEIMQQWLDLLIALI